MQVASWLLLQRAVNEGELTSSQAQAERVRVKLSREDYGCGPEIFEQLPPTLRSLSQRSLRIQERVMHLDQSLVVAHSREPIKAPSEVASQVERLRAAFSPLDGREPLARPVPIRRNSGDDPSLKPCLDRDLAAMVGDISVSDPLCRSCP